MDGTVHVPSFQLPPSEFMSAEGVDQLNARAGSSGELPFAIDQDFASVRAGIEKFIEPSVNYAKAHYAVEIAEQTFAGVRTRVITPAEGVRDDG